MISQKKRLIHTVFLVEWGPDWKGNDKSGSIDWDLG